MKFEEELSSKTHTPWRHLYVRYKDLSAELDSKSNGWNDQDEHGFFKSFQHELEKVYNFVDGNLAQLDRRVEQAEKSLSQISYDSLADQLTEILFDINDLAKYHQLNKTALDKLVKQHDKVTSLDLYSQYHGTLLERWPLDKIHFDVLIVRISHMQDICRLDGHPRSKLDYSQGEDQTAFERATSKYWIHPDNITEVKSIILMYLPIHVFNQRKAYEHTDAAVSSVYFDNANYDLYSDRLQRKEGAEAIRFRWYGAATDDIYIERKTHHAPWLNGHSVKDRFRLKEDKVNDFLDGRYTPSDLIHDLQTTRGLEPQAIEQNAFIAHGVQESLQKKNLAPMCRVFYNRTAFQLPGDQRLRLSLDHNLTFIREDDLDGQDRQPWKRRDVGVDYPFRHLPDQDIHRFPYAVLETKIQRHLGQESPPWLDSLLKSHLVHEVPRFSKYLHGASQLYKDQVPIQPWWICELEKDIRKSPLPNIGLSRSLSSKPLFNGHHRRSLADDSTTKDDHEKKQPVIPYIAIKLSDPDMAPTDKPSATRDLISRFWSGSYAEKKVKDDDALPPHNPRSRRRIVSLAASKKLDPKAFFANERTFISWLQFCALILTVALNLLNYGDRISRLIGAIFIILASIISIYALFRFQIRAYQMRTGRSLLRMDDVYGPAVLCILLVTALLVNFYLRAPLLTAPPT